MNWKLWVLALALAGAAVLAAWFLIPTDDGSVEITLLHTNDVHAHYVPFEPFGEPVQGGAARLATVIEEIRTRDDDVLLLDAGDQFQGTLYFTVGGADVVADVMNTLGYDAMCVGNHEFDAGPSELARLIEAADFPVLSANIDASADPDLGDELLPYSVFVFDGQPVAVIGLTTGHTAVSSSPGPKVEFLDVRSAAQQTVTEIQMLGINKIIALTHLGYEEDLALAASVHGIDVIVGGHSHTTLTDYPTRIMSASAEPVLVVTVGDWGRYLGELRVTFTAGGLIENYQGRMIPIDAAIPEDPAVLDILADYEDDIDTLMSTMVGVTNVSLNGEREDVRGRETNLGNLICDAMLWKTAAFETTIALQNGGGIRASAPKGVITMGQVLEILPYGNQISVLSLTGEQLWTALENGVSQVEDGGGGFPQVSGLRFWFDADADVGSRILSVDTWDDATSSYVSIDLNASYVLATNSFLAAGGDDYSAFAEAAALYGGYETGWLLSDALAEYLDAHAPVAPEIEGRIVPSSPEG